MLNRDQGELLPGLGRGKPVPTEKWADVAEMLNIAANAASQEFRKKGAPWPIKFMSDNVLVQEHHFHSMVIFLFWMKIRGQDFYYPYQFKLSDQMIGELAVIGKWPAVYAPLAAPIVVQ